MTVLLAAPPVASQEKTKDLLQTAHDFHAAVEVSAPDYPASMEVSSREIFDLFLGNPDPKLISGCKTQILDDFNRAVVKIGAILTNQSNERKKDEIIRSLWAVARMKKLFQILCDNGAESVHKVLHEVERSKDQGAIFDWDIEERKFPSLK